MFRFHVQGCWKVDLRTNIQNVQIPCPSVLKGWSENKYTECSDSMSKGDEGLSLEQIYIMFRFHVQVCWRVELRTNIQNVQIPCPRVLKGWSRNKYTECSDSMSKGVEGLSLEHIYRMFRFHVQVCWRVDLRTHIQNVQIPCPSVLKGWSENKYTECSDSMSKGVEGLSWEQIYILFRFHVQGCWMVDLRTNIQNVQIPCPSVLKGWSKNKYTECSDSMSKGVEWLI